MMEEDLKKFIDLLDYLKEKVENNSNKCEKYYVSKGNQNGFENLVSDLVNDENNAKEIQKKFNAKIILEFGHHFPDISVLINGATFGIELKSRNNGSWITNGGSAMESVTSDYDTIYAFFGTYTKKERIYHVKYKPYWQIIESIKVTHSPRFGLNMDATDTLFQSQKEYDDFRNDKDENKIKFIQSALRKSVSQITWYTPEEIKIEKYKTLPVESQKQIKTVLMILFPWDLLKSCIKDNKEYSKANYDNVINYCLVNYFVLVTRDLFSAGGQSSIHGIAIPKIMKHYIDARYEIINWLEKPSPDAYDLIENSWFSKDTPDYIKNVVQFYKKDKLSIIYREIINAIGEKYWKNTLLQIGFDDLSSMLFDK